MSEMYDRLARAIVEHQLVPVVGAGANRASRPPDYKWSIKGPEPRFAPDAGELSAYLQERLKESSDAAELAGESKTNLWKAFTDEEKVQLLKDLAKMAEALSLQLEEDLDLKNRIQEALDVDYTPTAVHEFLASIPSRLREANQSPSPYQLIITTNYDDVLERAFEAVNEQYDVVVYAPPAGSGKLDFAFVHYPYDGTPEEIKNPNDYSKIDYKARTVILKIHGATRRQQRPRRPENSSYVVSEDHYLDFMSRGNLTQLLPKTILSRFTSGGGMRFLFLGYSLRDWNLRPFIRTVLDASVSSKSYAIHLDASALEMAMWRKQAIAIHKMDLAVFIQELEGRLDQILEKIGATGDQGT